MVSLQSQLSPLLNRDVRRSRCGVATSPSACKVASAVAGVVAFAGAGAAISNSSRALQAPGAVPCATLPWSHRSRRREAASAGKLTLHDRLDSTKWSLRVCRPAVAAAEVNGRTLSTWLIPACFIAVAVANRVSNRILLAPLRAHTYFFAFVTSLLHLCAYSVWLCRRASLGLVTDSMWLFVKDHPLLLVAFGVCEGVFFPLVFYAAARLPGGLVQVLNQMLIPFTVLFSAVLLRRRYTLGRLIGVATALTGVLLFALDPVVAARSHVPVTFLNMTLCAGAYGMMALAMVLKEMVMSMYSDASRTASYTDSKARPLDCALVLTIGTLGRFMTVLLGWPLFLKLTGKPIAAVLSGITSGMETLFQPSVIPLALFYWLCNSGLSVLGLLMVRQSSASSTVLANVVALPLSALLFCCPLPLLEPQPFHWRFASSLLLVILGNLVYNKDMLRRKPSGAA